MSKLISKNQKGNKLQKQEALAKQKALLNAGYDLGKYGADGIWGNTSQTAWDKALVDGYTYQNGQLIKPKENKRASTYPNVHPTFGFNLSIFNRPKKTNEPKKISKSFDKKANARYLQTALKNNPFGKAYYLGKVDGDWGSGSKVAMIQSFKDAGYDQASINAMMNYVNNNIYSEEFDIKKMYALGKKKSLQPKKESIDSNSSAWDQVKNDSEFIQYLYSSGGKEASALQKILNVSNVGLNYIHGLVFPSGNTLYDAGDGTERQAVAAALYNKLHTGKAKIDDVAHVALGGMSGHSGKEFKEDEQELSLFQKLKKGIKQASTAPYHNIYGQSEDARFTEKGFESVGDNYTFNNVWEKDKVTQVLKDGEGDMGFISSAKSGYDALKSGSSLKAAMETAASNRGVNTKRHSDVTFIPQETLERWAQEYLNSKA